MIAFAIVTNIPEWVVVVGVGAGSAAGAKQNSVWVVSELSVEPVELVLVAALPISLVLSTGAG